MCVCVTTVGVVEERQGKNNIKKKGKKKKKRRQLYAAIQKNQVQLWHHSIIQNTIDTREISDKEQMRMEETKKTKIKTESKHGVMPITALHNLNNWTLALFYNRFYYFHLFL